MNRKKMSETKKINRSDLKKICAKVLEIEARVLTSISRGVDDSFAIAIESFFCDLINALLVFCFHISSPFLSE